MGIYFWSNNLKILCKLGMNLGGISAPFPCFQRSGESPGTHKAICASLGWNSSYLALSMWPTPDGYLIKVYLTQAYYSLKLTMSPMFRERMFSPEIFTVTLPLLFSDLCCLKLEVIGVFLCVPKIMPGSCVSHSLVRVYSRHIGILPTTSPPMWESSLS